jgi:hypothetical protein
LPLLLPWGEGILAHNRLYEAPAVRAWQMKHVLCTHIFGLPRPALDFCHGVQPPAAPLLHSSALYHFPACTCKWQFVVDTIFLPFGEEDVEMATRQAGASHDQATSSIRNVGGDLACLVDAVAFPPTQMRRNGQNWPWATDKIEQRELLQRIALGIASRRQSAAAAGPGARAGRAGSHNGVKYLQYNRLKYFL